jgi:hypothetical protein
MIVPDDDLPGSIVPEHDLPGGYETSNEVKKKFLAGTATRSQLAEAYKRETPGWNQTAWEKYRPDYAAGGWVTDITGSPALGTAANVLVNALPIALSGNLKPETAIRPEVQRLLDQGIVPTVGQAANPKTALGGMTRKAEDALMSVRGVGDVVAGSRMRALEEVNRAALNQAMPGAEKVSQVGNAGIQEMRDALGSAYDKLYAGKNVTAIPTQLWKGFQQAKSSTLLPLNAEGSNAFNAIIKKSFWDRLPMGNTLPADSVKAEMIGDIGKAANKFARSSTMAEQATGEALFNAKNVLQEWLNTATGAKSVASVDAAYKASFTLKKAAERAAAQGGVFTPYQLLKASKEGTSLNQLARDAQAVMGNSLPNSGTIDRGVMAYFLRNPSKALASIVGMVPTGALYSRPVQNALIQGVPGNASMLGPAAGELTGILRRPVQDSMVPLSDIPTGNR